MPYFLDFQDHAHAVFLAGSLPPVPNLNPSARRQPNGVPRFLTHLCGSVWAVAAAGRLHKHDAARWRATENVTEIKGISGDEAVRNPLLYSRASPTFCGQPFFCGGVRVEWLRAFFLGWFHVRFIRSPSA